MLLDAPEEKTSPRIRGTPFTTNANVTLSKRRIKGKQVPLKARGEASLDHVRVSVDSQQAEEIQYKKGDIFLLISRGTFCLGKDPALLRMKRCQ